MSDSEEPAAAYPEQVKKFIFSPIKNLTEEEPVEIIIPEVNNSAFSMSFLFRTAVF